MQKGGAPGSSSSIWTHFSCTECLVSFFPLFLVKRRLFLKAQDQGRMCHFSLHQKVLGTWGLSCLLLPRFLSLLTRGLKCGWGMVPGALGGAFCCFHKSRADLKTQNKDLDVLSCLSACVTRTFWASPRSAEPDFVHLQHLPSVLCPKVGIVCK